MSPYQPTKHGQVNSGVAISGPTAPEWGPMTNVPFGKFGPLDTSTGQVYQTEARKSSSWWSARGWGSPFEQLLDLIGTARRHYTYGDGSPPPPGNKGPDQGFPKPPRVLYLSPRKRGGRKHHHRKKR